MEKDTFSKATALFNFLSENFDVSQKIGDLKFLDIIEIIKFIDSDKFNELNKKSSL